MVAVGLLSVLNAQQLFAAEPGKPDANIEQRIQELVPKLETYVASGMKDFDDPGVAIGIVAGDKLVFGKATLQRDGDALVLGFKNGLQFKLAPWDGDVFTAQLAPNGRSAAVAQNLGPEPSGFVQFQMDKAGKLNLLRLSFEESQAYEFRRE